MHFGAHEAGNETPSARSWTALWPHQYATWIAAGLMLVALNAAVVWISGQFAYDRPLLEQPVLCFVAIELAAGTVFLVVACAIWWRRLGSPPGFWLVFVGIAMRCLMVCSSPILEHDYYRYLWDGAVLAHGMSPYRYAPAQVSDQADDVPAELRTLAKQSGSVLTRINHPELRTIYPPIAQAAFAAAYAIKPWSMMAWRCILACFDAATVLLLVRILRNLNLPLCSIVLYWWNPLVVREIFNAGHMDVVALPLALGAVMLSITGRTLPGVSVLALATGAKLWPLVLLPVVVTPVWRHPKQLIASVGLFGCLLLFLFAPVYLAGLDPGSGFVSYGLHWRVNDSLFSIFSAIVRWLLEALSWDSVKGYLVTRMAIGCLTLGWIGWLCRTTPRVPSDWWHRCLLMVASVFLLSPAGFPWYYMWVIPFLAIRPRLSLLLLNCLLPLYYTVFHYRARHEGDFFDTVIVWFEYVPVAGAMIYEWLAERQKP